MANHPYEKFENTNLWQVVEQSIFELEENQDLKLTTASEYVIGFICKKLDECKLLNETAVTENGNTEIKIENIG